MLKISDFDTDYSTNPLKCQYDHESYKIHWANNGDKGTLQLDPQTLIWHSDNLHLDTDRLTSIVKAVLKIKGAVFDSTFLRSVVRNLPKKMLVKYSQMA